MNHLILDAALFLVSLAGGCRLGIAIARKQVLASVSAQALTGTISPLTAAQTTTVDLPALAPDPTTGAKTLTVPTWQACQLLGHALPPYGGKDPAGLCTRCGAAF
jgi:hypothetical protein